MICLSSQAYATVGNERRRVTPVEMPDLDAALAANGAVRAGLLPGAAMTFSNATKITFAPLGR